MVMPANLVISNVPGPKVPLYLAGAKMLGYYPLSIVVHGMALNITVHSYAGQLDFGLIACARAVADLTPLAQAIEAEHIELKALAAQRLLGPVAHVKKPVKAVAKAPAKPNAKPAPAKAAVTKGAVAKKPKTKLSPVKNAAKAAVKKTVANQAVKKQPVIKAAAKKSSVKKAAVKPSAK